jgi:hypothetical protein
MHCNMVFKDKVVMTDNNINYWLIHDVFKTIGHSLSLYAPVSVPTEQSEKQLGPIFIFIYCYYSLSFSGML